MAVTSDLPYEINDADNHFNEPSDCFERYIDPTKKDLVIRDVTAPDGKVVRLFAGKPSKFLSSKDRQVTFSEAELLAMTGTTKEDALRESGSTQEQGAKDLRFVPGMLLNRLNCPQYPRIVHRQKSNQPQP